MTMTKPTPVHPILTCLHHSGWVIRTIPEHLLPTLYPLAPSWANSHLSNALPNPLTSLCDMSLNQCITDLMLLQPSVFLYQVDSRHPHPFPTWCYSTFSFCVKSTADVSSVLRLRLGEAWSCTSLARYVLVCPFLLSIYLFLLLSAVHFTMSHHLLPYTRSSVSSSVPRLHSPLFSSIFIPYLCQPYFSHSILSLRLIPDHYHTPHLYKYSKYKLL